MPDHFSLFFAGKDLAHIKSGKDLANIKSSMVCLPKKCADVCSLAYEVLGCKIGEIFSGAVILKDLSIMCSYESQVEKLVAARHQESESDFKSCFAKRCMEYKAFSRHKSQLASFCRLLESSELKIQGTILIFGMQGTINSHPPPMYAL